MAKTNNLWLILKLIFIVVFNVVFFIVLGVRHDATVWISYGFIHFAYLMLLLTPYMVRRGKSSAVFGFSVYSISGAYFLLQLIIGVIFICASIIIKKLLFDIELAQSNSMMFIDSVDLGFFNQYKAGFFEVYNAALPNVNPASVIVGNNVLLFLDNYKLSLTVQVILAGLFGIILISNLIANEHTAVAEEIRQPQIAYIKDASVKLKNLLDGLSDRECSKSVEKAYDALYSSPIKSHINVAQMEENILLLINDLESAISAGNKDGIISLANSLVKAINERNLQLRRYA